MNRRQFLKSAASSAIALYTLRAGADDGKIVGTVTLYDTYAMALYYDGGLGPQTGIIKVDDILANQPVTLDFWHGHGGVLHRYTVTPDHFRELTHLRKVMIETTEVEDHSHQLFI